MYNSTAGNLGGRCGYFFFGLSAICIVVIYFFIPETFNRSYAELDEIFQERVPARKTPDYVCKGTLAAHQPSQDAGTTVLPSV